MLAAAALGLFATLLPGEYLKTGQDQHPTALLDTCSVRILVSQDGGRAPTEIPFSASFLKDRTGNVRSTIHGFKINISRAKNSQLQAGSSRFVTNRFPVGLLLDYFARRPDVLSRNVLRVPVPGVLVRQDGSRLSSIDFNLGMRDILRLGGVSNPDNYSARGLRRGGAQSLFDAGASLGHIQSAGGWRSTQTPLSFYLHPSLAAADPLSQRMTSAPAAAPQARSHMAQ